MNEWKVGTVTLYLELEPCNQLLDSLQRNICDISFENKILAHFKYSFHFCFPLTASSSCLTGATKWAELWRLRDHANGHVHKPRPVPESRKQSPVGKHQASSSGDPSVTIISEGQSVSPVGVAAFSDPHTAVTVRPPRFGAVTYIVLHILNYVHFKKEVL